MNVIAPFAGLVVIAGLANAVALVYLTTTVVPGLGWLGLRLNAFEHAPTSDVGVGVSSYGSVAVGRGVSDGALVGVGCRVIVANAVALAGI